MLNPFICIPFIILVPMMTVLHPFCGTVALCCFLSNTCLLLPFNLLVTLIGFLLLFLVLVCFSSWFVVDRWWMYLSSFIAFSKSSLPVASGSNGFLLLILYLGSSGRWVFLILLCQLFFCTVLTCFCFIRLIIFYLW